MLTIFTGEMIIELKIMKSYHEIFLKLKPRVIGYRKYENFNNDAFVHTLRKELTKQRKVLD